ncbi:hypothetical protein ACFZCT_30965 [Streptomyces qaidamensis]|jgi:hypothetical protein|uniref:hypothetical protein n=1 Tax=Streptomyces qaidamensis TaxID=1783515 RepID=UPI0036F15535
MRWHFFLVDLQGVTLREVTGRGVDAGVGGQSLAVDKTMGGLAFQRVDLVLEPRSAGGLDQRAGGSLSPVERLG